MAKVTRRDRRALGRRGLPMTNTIDRGQQIIEDPERYFAEARERARKQVERDLERERHLSGA